MIEKDLGSHTAVLMDQKAIAEATSFLDQLHQKGHSPAQMMSLLNLATAILFKQCWEGHHGCTYESFLPQFTENLETIVGLLSEKPRTVQ